MLEKVKIILSKHTEQEITEDAQLRADLGLSSFDLVAIVSEFEDTFDLEISDRELSRFITVRDILDYLESHASC